MMQITKGRLKQIIKEEMESMQSPTPEDMSQPPEEPVQTLAPQSYRGFQIDVPSQDEEGNMITEEAKALYTTKLQDTIDSFYH